jgi:hypothetical protein
MIRLLKKSRLLRYAGLQRLRRTVKYASVVEALQALHPVVLEPPWWERFL